MNCNSSYDDHSRRLRSNATKQLGHNSNCQVLKKNIDFTQHTLRGKHIEQYSIPTRGQLGKRTPSYVRRTQDHQWKTSSETPNDAKSLYNKENWQTKMKCAVLSVKGGDPQQHQPPSLAPAPETSSNFELMEYCCHGRKQRSANSRISDSGKRSSASQSNK